MNVLSKIVSGLFVAALVLAPLHHGAAASKPPEAKSRFLVIAPHTPKIA